jgi:spoIIIJ-associated protein
MDTVEIKNLIENILQSMEISFDSVESTEDPETHEKIFTIKTQEPQILTGENGETFYALTHLIRRIASKDPAHPNNISIEVNDYQKDIMEAMKTKAIMLAQRAVELKSDIEMEPTSSYKRLIVHEALKDIPHIKTESIGEGRERRVMIRYVG